MLRLLADPTRLKNPRLPNLQCLSTPRTCFDESYLPYFERMVRSRTGHSSEKKFVRLEVSRPYEDNDSQKVFLQMVQMIVNDVVCITDADAHEDA